MGGFSAGASYPKMLHKAHISERDAKQPLRRRAALFSVSEVFKIIAYRLCNFCVVGCRGAVAIPFGFAVVAPTPDFLAVRPDIVESDREVVNLALSAVQHRDVDRGVILRNPQCGESNLDRDSVAQAGNAGSADQLRVLQQADLYGHLLQFGFKKVHGGFLRVLYFGAVFPLPLYTL